MAHGSKRRLVRLVLAAGVAAVIVAMGAFAISSASAAVLPVERTEGFGNTYSTIDSTQDGGPTFVNVTTATNTGITGDDQTVQVSMGMSFEF